MKPHYHDTTGVPRIQREQYELQARTQEQVILGYFLKEGRAMTPEEVHSAVLSRAPLTSVRRALTNMTTDGVLMKCAELAEGQYGRLIHRWCLCRTESPPETLDWVAQDVTRSEASRNAEGLS